MNKALDEDYQKNVRILWKFLPEIRKRIVDGVGEVSVGERWIKLRELGEADFSYLLCLAKANYWRHEAEAKKLRELNDD